jgi:hypothetical protein
LNNFIILSVYFLTIFLIVGNVSNPAEQQIASNSSRQAKLMEMVNIPDNNHTHAIQKTTMNTSNTNANDTGPERLIDQRITDLRYYVDVYYQGNETVVLKGYAQNPITGEPNTKLWQAVESLKHQFGYKLDKVLVNGLGSEANPERFYVILTK